MSRLVRLVKGVGIPVILIFLWELLVNYNFLPSTLDAKPTRIILTVYKFFFYESHAQYNLTYNIKISLFRLIVGVLLGAIFAVLAAYLNSKIRLLRELTNPFLTVIGPIPIVIWIPIFMMVFSGNDLYKIALISVATFLLIYLSMFSSFRAIDKKYFELSRIYEKRFWSRFYEISLPHSIEEFFTSLRFSIAIGWIVLFIVEYNNAPMNQGGLGYTIERFRSNGQTEETFASVLILALLSYLLDKSITILMKYKTRWKSKLNE
ncbi:MAG: ABC transporter permease subunit [Bacteroidota bacterium]